MSFKAAKQIQRRGEAVDDFFCKRPAAHSGDGCSTEALMMFPRSGARINHDHVRAQNLESQLSEATFARRSVGRLIVNAEREVLWASPALYEFFGTGSPLIILGGRIAAKDKSNQLRLEQLIEASNNDARRHDTLLATGRSGLGTIAVKAKGCPGGEGRIAMEVRRLDEEFDLDLPDFSSLYGLTPTEQEALCLILQGMSVNEIASRLGRSVMTVRTHVKHAYSKLNISSKEQLFATTLRLG